MPSKDDHIKQAEHNRSFWTDFDLSTTKYFDWVVTGLFYEGLHWIEAYLDTKEEHSGIHPDRLRNIKKYKTDIGIIRTDYELLKVESENARYKCYKHNESDISTDLLPLLEKIKGTVQGFLV